MLPYHKKLFIALVAYSAVLIGSIGCFQYVREKNFKTRELNMQLQMVNAGILETLDNHGDSLSTLKFLKPTGFEELRVTILDKRGNVMYDSSLDTLPDLNHLNREEVADALNAGEGFSIRRHSVTTDKTYFYSAKRGDKYIVRTAVPYSVPLQQLLTADYGFLWFMLAVTAAMCIIGYYATRRLGVHIERLNRFAKQAESGERITDIAPFPHDELGEISANIVRLYSQLQTATADRDRQHRLAMHEEMEKIRIKRQLTNNINHELKTPVTAMQVCLETLMNHPDMDADKRNEFIARCYKANERLGRLLADVSTLTRLEDGNRSITAETVDLSEIVAEICEEFEVGAEVKGVLIKNEIINPVYLSGNTSFLSAIFRNLLDNALAYAQATEIELRCRDDGDFVTVTVSDNGAGVAPEHLARLFERFYRIDKGRSRALGGTGLGLAIVKNVVQWHGGTIRVENKRTGGLMFTFTLKKTHVS